MKTENNTASGNEPLEQPGDSNRKVDALVRQISKRYHRRFRYDLLKAKIGQRYSAWRVYANYMTEEDAQKLLTINYHASTRLRRLGERWGYLERWEKLALKVDQSNGRVELHREEED